MNASTGCYVCPPLSSHCRRNWAQVGVQLPCLGAAAFSTSYLTRTRSIKAGPERACMASMAIEQSQAIACLCAPRPFGILVRA